MNNQKSFRSITTLCSIAFIVGGLSFSSALARPVIPDTDREPAPALTDAEMDGLVRGNTASMRTVVPYLNTRIRNFILHGEQIPKRVGGSADFHYRKMMTELLHAYDFLQVAKPYMQSSQFVQYSKEWRVLQSQVVLSQKLFLAQPSQSSMVLAAAVSRAKNLEQQLKTVDRLL